MVAAASEKIKKEELTDCHCHLIPAIDDGPADNLEALEMARILSSFGFSEVFCTPHILRGSYDNHPDQVRKAVENFQGILHKEGISLAIHAAVEYHLNEYLFNALDDPLTIGNDVILVEAHRYIQPQTLSETGYRIITGNKLRPLLAHPERYDLFDSALANKRPHGLFPFLWSWQWTRYILHRHDNSGQRQENEDILVTLREMGCLFQGNIGSFAGIYGSRIQRRAIRFLQKGLYDRLGTDAHRSEGLGDWLEKGMTIVEREIGRSGLLRLLQSW